MVLLSASINLWLSPLDVLGLVHTIPPLSSKLTPFVIVIAEPVPVYRYVLNTSSAYNGSPPALPAAAVRALVNLLMRYS